MQRKAFTLIELLIVVAIIAILAAIAVPNFLEAQTRSKVSRVKADMRSIATAIEAYQTDHNRYPPINAVWGYHWSLPSLISTPVAYISSAILRDPFNSGQFFQDDPYTRFNAATLDYWWATKEYYDSKGFGWYVGNAPGVDGTQPGAPRAKWDLMSKGPDAHWGHSNHPAGPGIELDNPQVWAYDPTNGTNSWGNIIRTGP